MSIERREVGHLEALYRISKALNSTLEVEETLQTMLDMALEIFSADAGSVMLEKDGFLVIKVSRGLEDSIVNGTRQKLGTGIAGWVALNGRPVQLDGRVEDQRFQHLIPRDEEISSSLSVPIAREDSVIGVLMLRARKRRFVEGELAFLQSVADLAAVALQKARLFQAERAQRHLLELEHSKLEATLASMADGVLVFDEGGQLLKCNRVAEDLLGSVLAGGLEKARVELAEFLEENEAELTLGERALRLVNTPLLVSGTESGTVTLIRDETSSRELERMKSEFLSMVSHELKTPITTIGAFLELLTVREFTKERRERFLGICSQECQRLETLIDQLLNLTRLEAGRFPVEKGDCDFSVIVQECVPGFSEPNPNHRFICKSPFPEARLTLDSNLIGQAVTNLLSNAVKYSPQGGVVEIALREEGSHFVLSVKDEGVGIATEKLKYVFERFFRADNSLTRSTGGTGLGLANVKHIALAHNGQVWVESELGEGSTFFFALPKEQEATENAED